MRVKWKNENKQLIRKDQIWLYYMNVKLEASSHIATHLPCAKPLKPLLFNPYISCIDKVLPSLRWQTVVRDKVVHSMSQLVHRSV